MTTKHRPVRDALFGFAVGDALGLPVEYKSRANLKENPVLDMTGHGTHNQPPGTWSDDSSLSFITAESLCDGYDIENYCHKLTDLYLRNHWTPHGRLFHIETSTRNAIERLSRGVSPKDSGDFEDYATGNGALMRIMPLAFHTLNDSMDVRFKKIEELSSITHSNRRSVLACLIYIEFCIQLLEGKSKVQAYKNTQDNVNAFFESYEICPQALRDFDRILKNSIGNFFEDEIRASCHVVYSLEAVLWSFMKGKSYKECVLKAVNLGEDTDTNAALAGALAAIFYGGDSIPEQWIELLPRKNEIEELAERYQKSLLTLEA